MTNFKIITIAFLAASTLTTYSSVFSQGSVAANTDAQARKAWRETIGHVALPKKGACYHASYPSSEWREVNCIIAPNRPFAQWLPNENKIKSMAAAANGQIQTVGNSVDYVAKVQGLIGTAAGQFAPSNVTTETGAAGANDYSLQLNSNFMNTAVCSGHPNCLAWQQYVYSSGEQALFIQYWLLNYGTCPSGWNTYSSDCWKNSSAVAVPTFPITELSSLALWAGAATDTDTILLTTGSFPGGGDASYSFTAPDSVLDLATGWNEAEYNIFGDGGGSAATFNSGASIGVSIQMREQGSSQTSPTCLSNAGTTGETNNLSLVGACAAGILTNTNPYISFTESN